MNKQEYLENLQGRMQGILDDYLFTNYRNQITARKLSASFTATYKENYLWNRALFLSSSGCKLLDEQIQKSLAIKCLKASAEIFESLSQVSENYDREYCTILAALCYDLAGYQANALCLVRNNPLYELATTEEEINLSSDNYILLQIRQILLKRIPEARTKLHSEKNDFGVLLFDEALAKWFDAILNGEENDFLEVASKTYRYFSNTFNIHISHLIFLLRSRMKIYTRRSIWNVLRTHEQISQSSSWTKYIKLLSYDAYDKNLIKQIGNRTSKFEFWTSQLRAIEKGLLTENSNFIIQMPTSAGKTFIAELAIIDALVKHPGKKCLYIAPYRALTNEKEEELATAISKLGYSVSALSGSYELDEFQEIVLEDNDVLIATPEKVDFLFRQNPDYFSRISLMVVDEGHIVGDISQRASLLEFLIIRLRIKVENLRILFISAVMPPENADEYSLWLNSASDKVIRSLMYDNSPITDEWEPTRKLIGSFEWSGNNGLITYKNISTENEETRASSAAFIPSIIQKKQFANLYPNGSNKAQTSASLAFRFSVDGNCLIFCSQVGFTESVGIALLNILSSLEQNGGEAPIHFRRNIETESYFFSKKWYGDNSYVTQCIERGIGIHYGDMPEAVRRSVESDYVSGKLRVLISTNTIGQGLNFPIKYLIIHSTIISRNKYVTVRDFWNIIGRAGRAGKETEGQIIFVINSPTDRRSYARYTDKSRIEASYSMFLNVLAALLQGRINETTYDQYMETISESYLLNLLAEETIETDDQEQIELIINNSLFKVQAEKRDFDLQPVRNSFSKIINNIKENVPADLLEVFGQTGFVLKSNNAINEFIDSKMDSLLETIFSDDYFEYLRLILELFSEGNIEEVISLKLQGVGNKMLDYFDTAKLWIQGREINEIQANWQTVSTDMSKLNVLISDGFYYRYTWGITAFTTVLISKIGMERNDLAENIQNLSSYIKYGVNNATACLARSLGIKNRDVALLLSVNAGGATGRDFIKWIANLTFEDVQGYNVNKYDRANIISIANKLTTRRYDEFPTVFEFWIKGIYFEQSRMEISRTLEAGQLLTCVRDPFNLHDPYAIKVFYNDIEVGYVPREYARLISVEIDINNAEYEIEIIDITEQEDYNLIFVRMTKI